MYYILTLVSMFLTIFAAVIALYGHSPTAVVLLLWSLAILSLRGDQK